MAMKGRSDSGFFGLDISSYQTITDANLLFSKVSYMYFRAYGTAHASGGDTSFVNFVALAKEHGVPSGGYFFGTPKASTTIEADAQAEADLFIAKLQEAYGTGNYGDLVPMLDIESYTRTVTNTDGTTSTVTEPMASGMTADQLTQWILAFRNRFYSQTQRAVGIYSNRYFLEDSTQMAMTYTHLSQLDIMPLWLSEWDRYYPNNATDGPATLGDWTNYNLWQYEVIADSDSYGVTSSNNEIDHDYTNDMALIMPPKAPTDVKITQISNTQIQVTFVPPSDSDYNGSDIYVDGAWKAWAAKTERIKNVTVSTPVGGQVQVNVVSQDLWQDKAWSSNTYHTMRDTTVVIQPPTAPTQETYVYTEKELKDMLHAAKGSRRIKFRYDLLDKNERKIRELTNVLSGEVSMNAFNTIKRTAKFSIREDAAEPIDFLSNRIQPFVLLKMPDKWVQTSTGSRQLIEGQWIEYPLGVFVLSSPTKKEQGDYIYRDVEAYDKLVILEEDKFTARHIVRKGTKYTDAIIAILQGAGITKYNITANDSTLKEDVEYEPGISKSSPIADFLNAINYTPLWVDDYGYFTSSPYISPQDKNPDYWYEPDEFSVVADGMEEELDLYSIPNSWVAYYSNADSVGPTNPNPVVITSVYTNASADSPTSTVNRGRTIVDYRKVDDIADKASLDAYVNRIAFEASQIFGKVKFETAIMPFHGFQDVLYLKNDTLGIDGKYAETSWNIKLQAGALMSHECRKVVNV